MTTRSLWIITGIATIVLIAFVIIALLLTSQTKSGFNNTAAVLTIVGLSAIGIERLTEGFWTLLGLTAGTWWPMNALSQQLMDKVNGLDERLQPFFTQVNGALANIKAGTDNWTDATIENAKKDILSFQNSIAQLKILPNDDQRAQFFVTTIQNGLQALNAKINFVDGGFEDMVHIAKGATDDISAFVATFKDNPGKRLISIYIGIILGLIIAGLLNLNLLSAALTTNQLKDLPIFVTSFGVILAGITMGLGAAPAHEIIQAIQEYKQNVQATATAGAFAGASVPFLMARIGAVVLDTRPKLHLPRS